MKKVVSAILAVCVLFCGTLTVTAATTEKVSATVGGIEIVPFASDYLSSWSPLLSKTQYGASIEFTGAYSGSVVVELHNSSGRIDSFSESFSNRAGVAFVTSRTIAAGSYKIVIKVTISGTTTTRESSFMNLS